MLCCGISTVVRFKFFLVNSNFMHSFASMCVCVCVCVRVTFTYSHCLILTWHLLHPFEATWPVCDTKHCCWPLLRPKTRATLTHDRASLPYSLWPTCVAMCSLSHMCVGVHLFYTSSLFVCVFKRTTTHSLVDCHVRHSLKYQLLYYCILFILFLLTTFDPSFIIH